MKTFPCSGCGCCCKRVDQLQNIAIFADIEPFPYRHDGTGRCEMLTRDNKCKVYDNRPLICNVDKFAELKNIPKKEFYELNAAHCNSLMDKDSVPLKFRINGI